VPGPTLGLTFRCTVTLLVESAPGVGRGAGGRRSDAPTAAAHPAIPYHPATYTTTFGARASRGSMPRVWPAGKYLVSFGSDSFCFVLSCDGGQGESLVPACTRGSASLS
jgi:hypothetical protein